MAPFRTQEHIRRALKFDAAPGKIHCKDLAALAKTDTGQCLFMKHRLNDHYMGILKFATDNDSTADGEPPLVDPNLVKWFEMSFRQKRTGEQGVRILKNAKDLLGYGPPFIGPDNLIVVIDEYPFAGDDKMTGLSPLTPKGIRDHHNFMAWAKKTLYAGVPDPTKYCGNPAILDPQTGKSYPIPYSRQNPNSMVTANTDPQFDYAWAMDPIKLGDTGAIVPLNPITMGMATVATSTFTIGNNHKAIPKHSLKYDSSGTKSTVRRVCNPEPSEPERSESHGVDDGNLPGNVNGTGSKGRESRLSVSSHSVKRSYIDAGKYEEALSLGKRL